MTDAHGVMWQQHEARGCEPDQADIIHGEGSSFHRAAEEEEMPDVHSGRPMLAIAIGNTRQKSPET